MGQIEEGLTALSEALDVVHKTGQRVDEAELYRLKEQLTLQQFKVQRRYPPSPPSGGGSRSVFSQSH